MSAPKPAHRDENQAVIGYLNAAEVSLGVAARRTNDTRIIRKITALSIKVAGLKESLREGL